MKATTNGSHGSHGEVPWQGPYLFDFAHSWPVVGSAGRNAILPILPMTPIPRLGAEVLETIKGSRSKAEKGLLL
ncbi:MAG: hypothetical protein SGI71_13350 [Verrucomicrobiota bacterium]|nr:hypothetical protein [Verrucomicrobiota bacterium]